jgi:hypothetical protein
MRDGHAYADEGPPKNAAANLGVAYAYLPKASLCSAFTSLTRIAPGNFGSAIEELGKSRSNRKR